MKNLAPYQVFFPLGLLNAMLAVGVWFVQNLAWFDSPVLLIHSKLIVGGFLWSFIVGFLMTAVPKMTGTLPADKFEYFAALVLMFGQTIYSWQADPRYFYTNQALLILFMIFFAGRRVLIMTKPLPVFFSHVAMAMVLAFVGCYYHATGRSFMGIHLYHVGTTLLLVLGIGTRFFSFLSGLPSEFENSAASGPRLFFHAAGVLMGVFLFMAGQGVPVAYLGLTLVSLVYLFAIWKVQRPSNRPSALKHGVRIVALMIPLSFFLTWLQPALYITWLHLLFIGCFGLITFAVATRVTLAHGSYSTDLELSSKALKFMVLFLVLGILCRIGYGYSGGNWQKSYLHSAATFWFMAVGGWCWAFLPKIFKLGPQAKPSC